MNKCIHFKYTNNKYQTVLEILFACKKSFVMMFKKIIRGHLEDSVMPSKCTIC